jgi:hypothetical protein
MKADHQEKHPRAIGGMEMTRIATRRDGKLALPAQINAEHQVCMQAAGKAAGGCNMKAQSHVSTAQKVKNGRSRNPKKQLLIRES